MQFTYHTKRLTLQILSTDYAPYVCDFYKRNRSFLEPFEPKRTPNFYTVSFHQSNLKYEYQASLNATYFRYWLFLQEEPDIPIGSVCFSNILYGSFQKAMLGYKMDEQMCRHGYMKEALSLLIPTFLTVRKLHRLEAFVQPDNTPSIQLLSSLHFEEEGYIRDFAEINGTWADHLLFSYLLPSGSSNSQ